MNPGDEVLYSIEVSGLKTNAAVSTMSARLNSRQVPGSYQLITPVSDKSSPGYIRVPRLFTRWRGDDAELAWKNGIRDSVGDLEGIITIHAEPWSPAPGYPQGELEEKRS